MHQLRWCKLSIQILTSFWDNKGPNEENQLGLTLKYQGGLYNINLNVPGVGNGNEQEG